LAEIGHELLVTYYDNGVTDGIYSGRIKGMTEMAEAIKIYWNIPVTDMKTIFGASTLFDIFETHSPNEFVDKCQKWSELHTTKNDKIKVGDYVRDCSGTLCVVTNIQSHIHVIYPNGKTHKWKKNSKFTKVGCSAPIMLDALEIMKENLEVLK